MLTDLLSDGGDAPLNIAADHGAYGREGGPEALASRVVSDDPEWKRKMLVAREQVMNCAEGKLTSMYVRYAEDAGLNVFDPQGRSAFVRGWAKEKGLLVSVCWEAFNELRKFMPMVSFVKVYGSADSVVSTITTKYTQQAKYRDRKGGDHPGGTRKGSLGLPASEAGYAMDAAQVAATGQPAAASSSTSADALREGMLVFVTTKLPPRRLVLEGIVKEVDRREGSVTLMLKAVDIGTCSPQEDLGWRQAPGGLLQNCHTLKDVSDTVQTNLGLLTDAITPLLKVSTALVVFPNDPSKRNEIEAFQTTWQTLLMQWKQSGGRKRMANQSTDEPAHKSSKM